MSTTSPNLTGAQRPPAPKYVPTPLTAHGHTRVDGYFWMRDRADPDVEAYLLAENAYTASKTAATKALQAQLYDEMVGRIKQTDLSAPYPLRGYVYYSRTEEGKQYPILCRRKGSMDGVEETLLDLNALAEGKPFLSLGVFEVSDDSTLLAYSLDETGYRQYTLFVKNLTTGELLPERIERVNDVAWAKDGRSLLYVTEDEVSKRSDTVWAQTLGQERRRVFFEADEIFDVSLARTRDGEFIIIESTARDTSEARYLPAGSPFSPPALFMPRKDGILYDVDHREGLFYIRTNENAPDFAVYSAPVAAPDRMHWTEVVPQRAGTTVTAVSLFRDFGVVCGRRDGLASLEIFDFSAKTLTPLTFDEADYVVNLGRNEEYATASLRIVYQSLVTPLCVYDVDVASGTRTLVKRTEVPGYDPSLYRTERVFARAADGTGIPISIVQRRDVPHDGSAPLLLYGYGSYGISIDPAFSAARLALLDRGVIYAIAHIRGGGEYGEAWRLAGNLKNKKTTFSDFIACAEHLIDRGYTAPDRLAIYGGSAGGLLLGAVMNARPELFRAAIVAVPFVDVLTTMLDASLPLTTGEYREWGNPNVKEDYDYMAGYSPYDNIEAKPYPAVLVRVSLYDSQVPYWEGAKYAAKLRAATTSAKPVYLSTNMAAGHGGASGRYDALREAAFNWAFILRETGAARETA